MYLRFLYVCQRATNEHWIKLKKKKTICESCIRTSKTKHFEQIQVFYWSKTKFPSTSSKKETKLFRFFSSSYFFSLSGRHCSCSVLTIIHQKVFIWIRVSFYIPVFMFIFDPNKEPIVNDVLQKIQHNYPNREKKPNSNETQIVNWIQWFRGLDIVSR